MGKNLIYSNLPKAIPQLQALFDCISIFDEENSRLDKSRIEFRIEINNPCHGTAWCDLNSRRVYVRRKLNIGSNDVPLQRIYKNNFNPLSVFGFFISQPELIRIPKQIKYLGEFKSVIGLETHRPNKVIDKIEIASRFLDRMLE